MLGHLVFEISVSWTVYNILSLSFGWKKYENVILEGIINLPKKLMRLNTSEWEPVKKQQ